MDTADFSTDACVQTEIFPHSSGHLLDILFYWVYWVVLLYNLSIHPIFTFHVFRIGIWRCYKIIIVSVCRALFNISHAISANVSRTKVRLVRDCLCLFYYYFFTHCTLPVSESPVKCTHLFCFCRWILIAWGMITVLCGTFIFGQSTFVAIMQVFHKLWFMSAFETLPLNRTLLRSTKLYKSMSTPNFTNFCWELHEYINMW